MPEESEFPAVNNRQDKRIMPLHQPVAGVEACYLHLISARLAYCALLHSELAEAATEREDYTAANYHLAQTQRASFMYDLVAEEFAQTVHVRNN